MDLRPRIEALGVVNYEGYIGDQFDARAVDELDQLINEWHVPSIRAVVIQSRPEDAGFT